MGSLHLIIVILISLFTIGTADKKCCGRKWTPEDCLVNMHWVPPGKSGGSPGNCICNEGYTKNKANECQEDEPDTTYLAYSKQLSSAGRAPIYVFKKKYDEDFVKVRTSSIPYNAYLPMITYNKEMRAMEVVGDYATGSNVNYHYFGDFVGNTWSAASSIQGTTRFDGRWNSAVVYTKQLGTLMIGGRYYTNSNTCTNSNYYYTETSSVLQIYSPSTWGGQFPSIPSISSPRGQMAATVYSNTIYISGGYGPSPSGYSCCNFRNYYCYYDGNYPYNHYSSQSYFVSNVVQSMNVGEVQGPQDVSQLKWVTLSPLSDYISGHSMQIRDDIMYLIGGYYGTGSACNSANDHITCPTSNDRRYVSKYDVQQQTYDKSYASLSYTHQTGASLIRQTELYTTLDTYTLYAIGGSTNYFEYGEIKNDGYLAFQAEQWPDSASGTTVSGALQFTEFSI